ncbi:MAG: phosphoglucosamine mutase [Bacteroidales bacterium]|nr:phosphoglucosamine mutase [Bacteroidales bacterium]
MTLIKSISGIRGTIGGPPGEGLSPVDVVKFTSGYGEWIKRRSDKENRMIIVGRDARISGDIINRLVTATLNSMGLDVTDIGMATTPTVEMAVIHENAGGGIIITASHNPGNWNALKLLNESGEFISDADGMEMLTIVENSGFIFSEVDHLGVTIIKPGYEEFHFNRITDLPEVDLDAIRLAGFTVAIDGVNSVGGTVVPKLLEKLGVKSVVRVNCEPTGSFAHNPEPLPENLGQIISAVKESGADVGFVVDPDVDRLAIVNEDGSLFNEEYTLVACSDYILSKRSGNTVSNMSSTRALRDVTGVYGGEWYTSAVGEVNVVKKMKEVNAVIGGEGNGGVIFPALHYGRDALVGIALFLSHLAQSRLKCSELRFKYPQYVISKNKISLPEGTNPDTIIDLLADEYDQLVTNRDDGLLLETAAGWVQVRKSNTEPIIRVYSEGSNQAEAENLAAGIIKSVKSYL